MTVSSMIEPGRSAPAALRRGWGVAVLGVAFGVALTLSMQGYQFGKSNHTVYLIDALRQVQPELLANDWFATRTLQYHAAFGWITRGLIRAEIIEPVFLIAYLSLVALFHLAWWRIVIALGGGVATLVIAEVLFHLSAGGTALGMYQFLQDAAFLPSNISAVTMLWGMGFYLAGRRALAAGLFGVAGLFHLNYALVGPAVWAGLTALRWRREQERPARREIVGGAVMLTLCAGSIIPALMVTWRQSGKLPLVEFVELYVRLRHPHHYDPLSWSWALWLSFLWPIPLAWVHWTRVLRRDSAEIRAVTATREAQRVTGLIMMLLLAALLGAGIWFVSETLVQMSLWRFSVFVKLLTVTGAAMWMQQALGERQRALAGAAVLAGALIVLICLVRGPYLGFYRIPEDEPGYLAACDWIASNTPVDAVFLVPPDEQSFRLRARRAIVVNFKSVPQLSGELRAWRERLSAVLALPDLALLPRPFERTLRAIRTRYDTLPPEHLAAAAREYGARYVLVGRSWGDAWAQRRIDLPEKTNWFLYDLAEPADRIAPGGKEPGP